jgi:hypothetical protein
MSIRETKQEDTNGGDPGKVSPDADEILRRPRVHRRLFKRLAGRSRLIIQGAENLPPIVLTREDSQ